MRRERKLGKLGEVEFEKLATQASVTANPSETDTKGWDYKLNLTLSRTEAAYDERPLDRDLRDMEALVQVKATDKSRGYIEGVKLSNWRSLALGTVNPAYFCILEFDEMDEAQRGYLVHVGKDLVRKVLKRLREIPSEQRDRLHKKKMRLSYSESHRLDDLSGTALRKRLIEPLNGRPFEYHAKKRSWISKLGNEGAQIRVDVSPPDDYPGSPRDYLKEIGLGIRSRLNVHSGEVRDIRFGQVSDVPATFQGGELEISVEGQDCVLELSTIGKQFDRVRFSGELFGPNQITNSLQSHEVRFSTSFADFVFNFDDCVQIALGGLSTSKDGKKSMYSLYEMAKYIQYVASNADDNERLVVYLESGNNTFRVGVLEASILREESMTDETVTFSAAVLWARQVFNEYTDVSIQRVDPSRLRLQSGLFLLLKSAYRSDTPGLTLEFWSLDGLDEHGILTVFVATVELGGWRLVAGLGATGEASCVDTREVNGHEIEQYAMEADHLEVIEKFVYRLDQEIPIGIPEFRELCSSKVGEESDHHVVVLQDGEPEEVFSADKDE